MSSNFSQKRVRYFDTAVKLFFDDGASLREISRVLPVTCDTIRHWCITFAESNPSNPRCAAYLESMSEKAALRNRDSQTETVMAKSKTEESLQAEIAALRAEVRRLQKAYDYEKLRADVNEMVIQVAEEDLKLDLRKKAGTK